MYIKAAAPPIVPAIAIARGPPLKLEYKTKYYQVNEILTTKLNMSGELQLKLFPFNVLENVQII